MKTGTDPIQSALGIFKQYKTLAERAIEQLNDEQLFAKPEPESNSIAIIMKHLAGNMLSRWTDFLTTDGEKEWRNRDSEFEVADNDTKKNLIAYWEKGWQCLFTALAPLTLNDTGRIVKIRNEEHSVLEAVNRQLAHYSYHVGQIVFIAKTLKSSQWQTLSIAKGKSQEFNNKMNRQ